MSEFSEGQSAVSELAKKAAPLVNTTVTRAQFPVELPPQYSRQPAEKEKLQKVKNEHAG